jgi:hypothetical protein
MMKRSGRIRVGEYKTKWRNGKERMWRAMCRIFEARPLTTRAEKRNGGSAGR